MKADHNKEELERTFNQADLDSDGILTKAEGEEWIKLFLKVKGHDLDYTKAFSQKLCNAICALNNWNAADQFDYKDWERAKEILTIWLDSSKAMNAAMKHMSPDDKAMVRCLRGMNPRGVFM